MATMITEVYDAFISAGTNEEKARAAAQALADFENNFSKLEAKIEKLEIKFQMLQWMMAANLTITIGILLKLIIN